MSNKKRIEARGGTSRNKIRIEVTVHKITEDEMTEEMKRAWNNVVEYLHGQVCRDINLCSNDKSKFFDEL
jgi:hypothetical protein